LCQSRSHVRFAWCESHAVSPVNRSTATIGNARTHATSPCSSHEKPCGCRLVVIGWMLGFAPDSAPETHAACDAGATCQMAMRWLHGSCHAIGLQVHKAAKHSPRQKIEASRSSSRRQRRLVDVKRHCDTRRVSATTDCTVHRWTSGCLSTHLSTL
jgi:hypothetical protein